MGIFARLATLIKSNLNDLISKAEDPQKMLNQIVVEMQNQLVEAKKQVAVSIADEKRLAKQAEQEAANVAEWERRAMLAIKAGDDGLAKEALARKKAQGIKLGNPNLAKSQHLGWEAARANAAAFAANVFPIIEQIQASGITSMRGIARALNERKVPTARGAPWSESTLRGMYSRRKAT